MFVLLTDSQITYDSDRSILSISILCLNGKMSSSQVEEGAEEVGDSYLNMDQTEVSHYGFVISFLRSSR